MNIISTLQKQPFFILTYDDKIKIKQLGRSLPNLNLVKQQPGKSGRCRLLLTKQMVDTQHNLSLKNIPSAMLDKASLNRNLRNLTCHKNRPMYVILSNGSDTPHGLKEIFSKVYPSYPRWLLFLGDNSTAVEEYLGFVKIPFDCEFLVALGSNPVLLSEAYQVSSTRPIQTSNWGSWNTRDGLRPPHSSLYERRNDLQNIVLNASIIHDPPGVSVTEGKDGKLEVVSVFYDLCQNIADRINMSLKVRRTVNNTFGTQNKDGSWTGGIGMLMAGTSDLTLDAFYITKPRLDVVDYTITVWSEKTCVFIKTPNIWDSTWGAFLSPFTLLLWLAVGAAVFFTALHLAALHTVARTRVPQHLSAPGYNLQDSFLCVWGSICAQGHYTTPGLLSGRVLHWMIFIVALIVLSAYSASFTSLLTLRNVVLPFRSWYELLKDDSYDFVVVANSTIYKQFQDAQDDVPRELFRRKIEPYDQPPTVRAAFRHICKKRAAFFTECIYQQMFRDAVTCDLSVLPEASSLQVLALVVPKNSSYLGIINHKFQRILEAGSLQRVLLGEEFRFMYEKEFEMVTSVELSSVIPLLTLSGVGVILGVLCLLVEASLKTVHRRM